MVEALEFEGKNTEEAIYRACRHFDTTPEKLDIQILSTGSTGIFGLVGSKKARIKAYFKEQPPEEPLVDLSDLEQEFPRDRGESELPKPEVVEAAVPEEVTEEPHPVEPPVTAKVEVSAEPPVTAEIEVSAEPPVTAEVEAAAEPPVTAEIEAAAEPQAEKAADEEELDLEIEDEQEEEARPAASQEDVQQALEIAREHLSKMIELSGMEARVEGEISENRIVMNVVGESSGLLIGKKGKTLDAIQYILSKMVSKQLGKRAYVVVDSENYRGRRKKSLAEMALRLGEKAKKVGKPITISPMNAHDRRVVHLALQSDKQLKTRSKGDGLLKRIVILPQRLNRGRGPKPS